MPGHFYYFDRQLINYLMSVLEIPHYFHLLKQDQNIEEKKYYDLQDRASAIQRHYIYGIIQNYIDDYQIHYHYLYINRIFHNNHPDLYFQCFQNLIFFFEAKHTQYLNMYLKHHLVYNHLINILLYFQYKLLQQHHLHNHQDIERQHQNYLLLNQLDLRYYIQILHLVEYMNQLKFHQFVYLYQVYLYRLMYMVFQVQRHHLPLRGLFRQDKRYKYDLRHIDLLHKGLIYKLYQGPPNHPLLR